MPLKKKKLVDVGFNR